MVKSTFLAASLLLLRACSCSHTTYMIKVRNHGTLDPYLAAGSDEEEDHYLCRQTEIAEDDNENKAASYRVRRLAIRSETDYIMGGERTASECRWGLLPLKYKPTPEATYQPPQTFGLWAPGEYRDSSSNPGLKRPLWLVPPTHSARPYVAVHYDRPIRFIGPRTEDFLNPDQDPVGRNEMQLVSLLQNEQPLYECRSAKSPEEKTENYGESKNSEGEKDEDDGPDFDARWDIYTPPAFQHADKLGLKDCNKIDFWIQPKEFSVVPDTVASEEKIIIQKEEKKAQELARLQRVRQLKENLASENPPNDERIARIIKAEQALEEEQRRNEQDNPDGDYENDDDEDFKYPFRVPRFQGETFTSHVYRKPAHLATARRRRMLETRVKEEKRIKAELKARLLERLKAEQEGKTEQDKEHNVDEPASGGEPGSLLGKRPMQVPADGTQGSHCQNSNGCSYFSEDKPGDSDEAVEPGSPDSSTEEPKLVKQIHTGEKTGVKIPQPIVGGRPADIPRPPGAMGRDMFEVGDWVIVAPEAGQKKMMPVLSRIVGRDLEGRYVVRPPKVNLGKGVKLAVPVLDGSRLLFVRRMRDAAPEGQMHVDPELFAVATRGWQEIIDREGASVEHGRKSSSKSALLAQACYDQLQKLAFDHNDPPPPSADDMALAERLLAQPWQRGQRAPEIRLHYRGDDVPRTEDVPAPGWTLPSGNGRWNPNRPGMLKPLDEPKREIKPIHSLTFQRHMINKRLLAGKNPHPEFDSERSRQTLMDRGSISFDLKHLKPHEMNDDESAKFSEAIKYWNPLMRADRFWEMTPEKLERHRGQQLQRDEQRFEIPDTPVGPAEDEAHYGDGDSTPSDIVDAPDRDPDPEDDGGYIGDSDEKGSASKDERQSGV